MPRRPERSECSGRPGWFRRSDTSAGPDDTAASVRDSGGRECYLPAGVRRPDQSALGAYVQQLHLVGFTTDHEGLIFSPRKGAKSGGFVVLVDERLLERIEEAVALMNGTTRGGQKKSSSQRLTFEIPKPPRPQSGLTPREMQARLRAGRTVDEVAAEAGVDEEWVARFSVPVLAEQAQVVERAGRMVFSKQRLGLSTMPLHDAVARNLVDKGIVLPEDRFEQAWSAYQQRDGTWIVRFAYVSRKHSQRAEWIADFHDKTLFARNRLASELAYVEKGRGRRGVPFLPPAEVPQPPPEAPADEETPEEEEPRRPRRTAGARRAAKRARKSASGGRRVAGRRPATKRGSSTRAAANKAARPAKTAGRVAKAAGAGKAKRAGTATRPAKAAGRVRKAAGRATTKRPPAKKAAPAKRVAKRAATKKVAGPAKRAATRKAAPAKRVAKRAATKKAAAPAKRPATKRAGAKKAAASKRTVVKKATGPSKAGPTRAAAGAKKRRTVNKVAKAAQPRRVGRVAATVAGAGSDGAARPERPLRVRPLVAPGRQTVRASHLAGDRGRGMTATPSPTFDLPTASYPAPVPSVPAAGPASPRPTLVIRAPLASAQLSTSL
jgi:hypothetical protein